MRVEYDGIVYDTETAVCVGEYGEGFYYWPNHNIWMGLYINKDGGLFLYGTGGPLLKAIAIDSDNEHAIYLLCCLYRHEHCPCSSCGRSITAFNFKHTKGFQ